MKLFQTKFGSLIRDVSGIVENEGFSSMLAALLGPSSLPNMLRVRGMKSKYHDTRLQYLEVIWVG